MKISTSVPLKFAVLVATAHCFQGCTPVQPVQQARPYPHLKVTLKCSTVRPAYFLLEPIPLTISATAGPNSEINWRSGSDPFQFRVFDENGKEFPPTGYGKGHLKNIASQRSKLQGSSLTSNGSTENIARQPGVSMSGFGTLNNTLSAKNPLSDSVFINQYVDLTQLKAQPNEREFVYIEVERYGRKSNRLKVAIINRVFDLNDSSIVEALRTGKYNGKSIK